MRISDLDPKERRLIFLIRLCGEVEAESRRQENIKIAAQVLEAVRGDTAESEETRESAARILDRLTSERG